MQLIKFEPTSKAYGNAKQSLPQQLRLKSQRIWGASSPISRWRSPIYRSISPYMTSLKHSIFPISGSPTSSIRN